MDVHVAQSILRLSDLTGRLHVHVHVAQGVLRLPDLHGGGMTEFVGPDIMNLLAGRLPDLSIKMLARGCVCGPNHIEAAGPDHAVASMRVYMCGPKV